eukprot:CAMPEP_0181355412 /NCGR_PEP_ID=MMETSP1106-20121128/3885_1 /TAXON_ID=81844 /ORGANISM="Mantoniella antarctica, Strain SL-175" /LENGTH=469 /DNA_ID=CAMNT_0023468149 /DNA_START=39 /DNA_END=1448 /DNA_ORIENTATION=-
MNDRHQELSEDSDVQRSDADDAPRDPDGVGEASINVFGDIVERRKRVWLNKLRQQQASALAGGSLASNAFKYDKGPRGVPVFSRAVAMQERLRAHVAHKAALSKIKKSGKTRHARVDNATPRVLQYAHIRAEGLERRRQTEEEARHVEDPRMQHGLQRAAQVGSSGIRPADYGSPSREHANAAETATRGGAYGRIGFGGGGGDGGGGNGEGHGGSKPEAKGRGTSAGLTRPALGNTDNNAGVVSRRKAAWDASLPPPPSKAAAAAKPGGPATRAQSAGHTRPSRLVPGGGGAYIDDPAARDRRAGGRADEYKAARRRKETAVIAAENRRTYERILGAKPHYPKSDGAAHAAKHRAVLEMHHEARGSLPDMMSELTKEPQARFVSFGMGVYTLYDKKHGHVGGVGSVLPPWHRTVGGDVRERLVEHIAPVPHAEVPPWLDGTGVPADDDGMAARLFKKNFMDTDTRAWKD